MTRKAMMTAVVTLLMMGGSMHAQQPGSVVKRNYFQYTDNSKDNQQQVSQRVGTPVASEGESGDKRDYISRTFRYVSMCDWYPGMRFMCLPTREDMVFQIFSEASTGNLISTRRLAERVLIFDNHSNSSGSLHERVNFHVEDSGEQFYFEVPSASFDDYCYGKSGVPTLVYLGDVDMAQDSLVGKKVKLNERYFCQDFEVRGSGFRVVDLGDSARGKTVTITKVGVGTRNYPVKIIFKEPDVNGKRGSEYFQYVTISRTNCGMRDEDFERGDVKLHTFQGSFVLMDDRMAVSPELEKWVGRDVYTFFDTQMRDAVEKQRSIPRLTPFTVTDIYRLGDSPLVTLELKQAGKDEKFTKEVSISRTKVNGNEEVLDELFVEGSLNAMEGVKVSNLPLIRKRQVKKGFTEQEVRLALGEPSEVRDDFGSYYQWIYQYIDTNRPFRSVKFVKKTKKVAQDVTR